MARLVMFTTEQETKIAVNPNKVVAVQKVGDNVTELVTNVSGVIYKVKGGYADVVQKLSRGN